jgi:hypothetical protein
MAHYYNSIRKYDLALKHALQAYSMIENSKSLDLLITTTENLLISYENLADFKNELKFH